MNETQEKTLREDVRRACGNCHRPYRGRLPRVCGCLPIGLALLPQWSVERSNQKYLVTFAGEVVGAYRTPGEVYARIAEYADMLAPI